MEPSDGRKVHLRGLWVQLEEQAGGWDSGGRWAQRRFKNGKEE